MTTEQALIVFLGYSETEIPEYPPHFDLAQRQPVTPELFAAHLAKCHQAHVALMNLVAHMQNGIGLGKRDIAWILRTINDYDYEVAVAVQTALTDLQDVLQDFTKRYGVQLDLITRLKQAL